MVRLLKAMAAAALVLLVGVAILTFVGWLIFAAPTWVFAAAIVLGVFAALTHIFYEALV